VHDLPNQFHRASRHLGSGWPHRRRASRRPPDYWSQIRRRKRVGVGKPLRTSETLAPKLSGSRFRKMRRATGDERTCPAKIGSCIRSRTAPAPLPVATRPLTRLARSHVNVQSRSGAKSDVSCDRADHTSRHHVAGRGPKPDQNLRSRARER
jgi:hypothetical protein